MAIVSDHPIIDPPGPTVIGGYYFNDAVRTGTYAFTISQNLNLLDRYRKKNQRIPIIMMPQPRWVT